MAKKFYVDKNHPEAGIYENWAECEERKKKGGASFIGFETKDEAKAFFAGEIASSEKSDSDYNDKIRVFYANHSDAYEVHSDGGAKGNPGPAAYGYVVLNPAKEIIAEGYGSEKHSTNNRMELRGAIEGLKCVPDGANVILLTDSTYVYRGFAKNFPPDEPRYERWEKNGWKECKKNPDLVKELYQLGKAHNLVCIPRPIGENGYKKLAHKPAKDGVYRFPYNVICDKLVGLGREDLNDYDKQVIVDKEQKSKIAYYVEGRTDIGAGRVTEKQL